MTYVMTPVAKEALRAQVLRLQANVDTLYAEKEQKYIEECIPDCAILKRNRTYARALAKEEVRRFSALHWIRNAKYATKELYKTLLLACDNAVDVVHLDFETLKRVFG